MPLPEHAGLGDGLIKTDASPDIPDEDQKTVKMVLRLFERYKKHRAKYDRNWMHYYKMFRGDQWSKRRPSYRHSEVINLVFQAIQSSLPLQTDVRPKISFVAEEPEDQEFATVLNEIAESDWDRYNWLEPLTEVILDGYLYGTGMSSLGYDAELDYGLGSVVYRSEDPFYCYPSPDARNINDPTSQGFIHAEPVETDTVKNRYPDKAHLIKPDITDFVRSSKVAISDFKLNRANTDRDMPDVTSDSGQDSSEKRTLLITAYLKPEETEECEERDQDDVRYVLRKKYPRGRKVVIASGILLEDEELPYEHGEIPFSRYINYILPREFYGISEVEQLESPQRTFNKLLNFSLDVLTLMGNPIWVVDSSSGVNTDMLVSRPGLVVEKEPGSEVRREEGEQLQPYVLQLTDRLVTWFNDVAGSQDVTRGATPGSVTAASAIEQLQEAARTRIRQKQRHLDAYIRDFGRQYVSLVLEKYSAPRVFRVTNNEGSTKYFKFSSQPIERQTPSGISERNYEVSVRHYSFDPESDAYVPANEAVPFLVKGRFDVKANTGSSLPFSVADKEQKALNLFDRGIIDEEEVLKQIDYPNRDAILARLQQRREAQAQAEQQQA